MNKYPLTSAGIVQLQELLYGMSDEKLRAEATLLAADPCGWIISHIELQVHQLECLRIIKQDFMQMFGWHVAAAMIARRPISLSYRESVAGSETAKNPCILYDCKGSNHWDSKVVSSTGSLHIVISE